MMFAENITGSLVNGVDYAIKQAYLNVPKTENTFEKTKMPASCQLSKNATQQPQRVGFKKLVFHPFFNKIASGSIPLKW